MILRNVLQKSRIATIFEVNNTIGNRTQFEMFSCDIRDYKAFNQLFKLFFTLYMLEKWYHIKFPRNKENPHHMRSRYPPTEQARIINLNNNILLLTYFPFHYEYVIHTKEFIIDDLHGAIQRFARRINKTMPCSHFTRPEFCPIIISFKYHLLMSHHLDRITCDIFNSYLEKISKYECNTKECPCIRELIAQSKHYIKLVKVFGGKYLFFNRLKFDEISILFTEEIDSLEKHSLYETIVNFLMGCYLSDKYNVYFNSNVRISILDYQIQLDILLKEKDLKDIPGRLILIETTREHDVYNPKSLNKKLVDPFRHVAVLSSSLVNAKEYKDIKDRFLYLLISLSKGLSEGHPSNTIHEQILEFGESTFNLTAIDIDNDSLHKYLTNPGYFNVDRLVDILNHLKVKLDTCLDSYIVCPRWVSDSISFLTNPARIQDKL